MPQWRKLWVKATESLDINDMPDDFHRLLWILMPLGLDAEGRGLDNPSWIKAKTMPLRLDVTLGMVEEAMCWYATRGMIERYQVEGRGFFWLPTFATYQGNTEREARSQYPAPTGTAQESLVKQVSGESRPSQDLVMTNSCSDADADAEIEEIEEMQAQSAPLQAAKPPAPPAEKAARADKRSDPRSKAPAIQCARMIIGGRYPPIELYDEVISILGDNPDTKRLAECRRAWVERGYNGNAWTWLTEWYPDGIPGRRMARIAPESPPDSNGDGHGDGDEPLPTVAIDPAKIIHWTKEPAHGNRQRTT